MEEIKSPRLLVVGGTGFIGSQLLKAVVRKGWICSSLSLHSPSHDRNIDGVEYLQCDINDTNRLASVVSCGYDYVVNLGGYIDHKKYTDGGAELIDSHFVGLMNLVQVLPKSDLKCFVQIGSSDEYGSAKSPQHEELREQPISPYSLAKVASTHFLQMLHRTEAFPAVVLRLFLTYGPGQDIKRFLPQIIVGCLKNEQFPVSGGRQIRDFCYVDDVVRAIVLSLTTEKAKGEVINIASGTPVTIRTVIETVRSVIGGGRPIFGVVPYRDGENMELFASQDKASSLLGWKASTLMEEGLRKTISAFKIVSEEY